MSELEREIEIDRLRKLIDGLKVSKRNNSFVSYKALINQCETKIKVLQFKPRRNKNPCGWGWENPYYEPHPEAF